MHRRHAGRLAVLAVAALVAVSVAAPAQVSAADALGRILAGGPWDGPSVDLLVGPHPGRGGALAALTAGLGSRDKGSVRGLGVHRLRVPAEAAAALERTLATDPSVGYVEVDGKARATVEPDDPEYGSSGTWGLPLIGAPLAWETSTGAEGPIIAVVDTGVDADHPDLGDRVLAGIDLVNGDDDAGDDNGHGTHVAGIVAATGNNTIGGAGVCWGCRILPVKALGADGSGSYSTVAAGITWAADHGARVINLSLGGTSDSLTLRSAVTYATDRGSVVVAAAGNSGGSSRFYPAAFDEVIAVGAADRNGARYAFSDYGTDWVDVAAGGCSVSIWPGGGYTSLCGTSMAAPFVSGSLGLLLAADPEATPSAAETALEATAGPEGAAWTARGVIHLDRAMVALLWGTIPVLTPVPLPPPTPTATPKPPVAPPTATRSGSLASVPRTIVASVAAGSARISVSNPRHQHLVLTLRRGATVVWRGSTRSATVHWAVHLRTAGYTLTVTRPGSRVATGTISFTYQRR